MKQALEALEWNYGTDLENIENCTAWLDKLNATIPALRQAIAEAEKQEQKTPLKVLGLTVFTENRLRNGRVYDVETLQAMTNRDILAIPDMGKKALKEVLEALNVYASDISQKRVDETAKCGHDWGLVTDDALIEEVRRRGFTIRDAQISAKRWVGLTDEEREQVRSSVGYTQFMSAGEYAETVQWATEAKLKEKNHEPSHD